MKIVDIILIILAIISVVMAGWYLFGDSPTFEQAILIFILTFLIANNSKLIKLETKFFHLEKSFTYLAKDFKQHIKHKQK